MHMRHGLSRRLALIVNQSKAVFQLRNSSRYILDLGKTPPQRGGSIPVKTSDVGIMLLGYHEQMHGRLRIDIFDDNHIVVFVYPLRRDFSGYYFAKDNINEKKLEQQYLKLHKYIYGKEYGE